MHFIEFFPLEKYHQTVFLQTFFTQVFDFIQTKVQEVRTKIIYCNAWRPKSSISTWS